MDARSVSAVISAADARRLLSGRSQPIPRADVTRYAAEIAAALAAGEVDAAFRRFQDWLTREARYAHHGHESNLCDLVETMLQMLGWMYERVPRTIVRTAAAAAAA